MPKSTEKREPEREYLCENLCASVRCVGVGSAFVVVFVSFLPYFSAFDTPQSCNQGVYGTYREVSTHLSI